MFSTPLLGGSQILLPFRPSPGQFSKSPIPRRENPPPVWGYTGIHPRPPRLRGILRDFRFYHVVGLRQAIPGLLSGIYLPPPAHSRSITQIMKSWNRISIFRKSHPSPYIIYLPYLLSLGVLYLFNFDDLDSCFVLISSAVNRTNEQLSNVFISAHVR